MRALAVMFLLVVASWHASTAEAEAKDDGTRSGAEVVVGCDVGAGGPPYNECTTVAIPARASDNSVRLHVCGSFYPGVNSAYYRVVDATNGITVFSGYLAIGCLNPQPVITGLYASYFAHIYQAAPTATIRLQNTGY